MGVELFACEYIDLPDDWQKIDRIFTRALELEGAAREAFLVERCAGNVALETEVRRYLTMAELSGGFLESAPEIPDVTDPENLRQAVEQGVNDKGFRHDLETNTQLGAYRIVESISAGGMGSVYLAERADGQFEQRVAIKVMHQARGGAYLVERFLRERQILARLEHPNIARLIDGGVTGDGRPYLIMEFVEGEDIISYCSNRELPSAERAIAINPLALEPFHNLVFSLLIFGRYEQALEEFRSRQWPRAPWESDDFYKGVVLYQLGRYQEAIDTLDGLSVPWAGEGPLVTLALAQAALGDLEEARRVLVILEQRKAHLFLIGLLQVALGDKEAAWQSFELAQRWDENSDWPTLAARYLYRELLGDMVADPRFIALLDRINRAWGLPERQTVDGTSEQSIHSGGSEPSR